MATNRSKSSSSSGTGLRILWIPGKKKQPKGSYNPTKKSNLSANHQQKKIEPWSLGGSKGQNDLLKSEIPGGEMASPSIMNCLPQTMGISAVCADPNAPKVSDAQKEAEEGAVGGPNPESLAHDPNHMLCTNLNGVVNIKTESPESPVPSVSPTQPLSPRLGPLANIDEDEHEDDLDDSRDDYCGASSNTATLQLRDRRINKRILPSTEKDIPGADEDEEEEEEKKDPEKGKFDTADGVPHMRGLNRKQTLERSYRDQEKHNGREREVLPSNLNLDRKKDSNRSKNKNKKKETGMNEKAVDCLYMGLMCCECSIQ